MPTPFYDLTIPVFIRGLHTLSKLLATGAAFAADTGVEPSTLTTARLIEDMAPLTAQIQRASDSAKGFAVRVGGVVNLAMADEEVSFADLQARIAKTIAFLEAVPRDAIDGKEDSSVSLETPQKTFTFAARDYALQFALPNFYFHLTTAYALLRANGVPLTKMDYLGGI